MVQPETIAFVSVGSNLEPRRKTIEAAILRLRKTSGVRLKGVSSLYETQPVGGPRQGKFLNAVLKIGVRGLKPPGLLRRLLKIEDALGRKRTLRRGPRSIDLDLLTYGAARSKGRELTLPHPRYHRRRFVLVPFCELAPDLVHPRLGVTNSQLLRRLTLHGQRVTMAATWKSARFRPSGKRKN